MPQASSAARYHRDVMRCRGFVADALASSQGPGRGGGMAYAIVRATPRSFAGEGEGAWLDTAEARHVARFHATRRAYPRWARPAVDPARHRSPALGCTPPHAPARPRRASPSGPARPARAVARARGTTQFRRTAGGTRGSHPHADEPAQDRAGSPPSSRDCCGADQTAALHHRAPAERIDLPARPAGTRSRQSHPVALGAAKPFAASAARDLCHRSAHRGRRATAALVLPARSRLREDSPDRRPHARGVRHHAQPLLLELPVLVHLVRSVVPGVAGGAGPHAGVSLSPKVPPAAPVAVSGRALGPEGPTAPAGPAGAV